MIIYVNFNQCDGYIPETQIIYFTPVLSVSVFSFGKAKVFLPSPPYRVPIILYKIKFDVIVIICPSQYKYPFGNLKMYNFIYFYIKLYNI